MRYFVHVTRGKSRVQTRERKVFYSACICANLKALANPLTVNSAITQAKRGTWNVYLLYSCREVRRKRGRIGREKGTVERKKVSPPVSCKIFSANTLYNALFYHSKSLNCRELYLSLCVHEAWIHFWRLVDVFSRFKRIKKWGLVTEIRLLTISIARNRIGWVEIQNHFFTDVLLHIICVIFYPKCVKRWT